MVLHMECVSQLAKFLYTENTRTNALKAYSRFLRGQVDDPTSIMHANAIDLYNRQITNRSFGTLLKQIFGKLEKVIIKEMPDTLFQLGGRQKAVVSTERKICRTLAQGNCVETLKDTFAFRVTTFGKTDPQEAFDELYSISNKIINFFLQEGYVLCPTAIRSETIVDTTTSNVLIPEYSGIKDEFKPNIKDYVLHPKANGYQSIHVVFLDPRTRYHFEVQVRTFEMDIRATSGSANHKVYKDITYVHLDLDRTKISMAGYNVTPDGNVCDLIGIEQPIILTHMVKTY